MAVGQMGFAARILSLCCCLALFTPVPALAADGEKSSSPTNVVIIMAYVVGYQDIGVHGLTTVDTPFIDSIAKDGVRFSNAYSAGCVSELAIPGLLTGRYQQRWKQSTSPLALSPDEVTMAEVFQGKGYASAWFNIWSQGGRGQHPHYQGFTETSENALLKFLRDTRRYRLPGLDGQSVEVTETTMRLHEMAKAKPMPSVTVKDSGWRPDSWTSTFANFRYSSYVAHACDFIHRHADKPFFLVAGTGLPGWHPQRFKKVDSYMQSVTQADLPDLSGKYFQRRRGALAAVKILDDGVGMILDSLAQHGLTDNTLVVFMSDTGGNHRDGADNGPYKGGVYMLSEGGLRIPLLMRWPGQIRAGTVIDPFVSGMDLMPTLLAATGLSLPAGRDYDGINLWPLITGEVDKIPTRSLCWDMVKNYGPHRVIVRDPYRLEVRTKGSDQLGPLYNVRTDPGTEQDLSTDHPDIAKSLRDEFYAWQASMQEASSHVKTNLPYIRKLKKYREYRVSD